MRTAGYGRVLWPIAGLLLLTATLAGCQRMIVGHWKLVEAKPNREVFAIEDADFRGDGTFSATTTVEGLTSRESGKYDFIGYKLKLRPDAGGQHTYTTQFQVNHRLIIKDGKRHVVLMRTGKAGSDGRAQR